MILAGLEPWTRVLAGDLILAEPPDPHLVLARAIRTWRRRAGHTSAALALLVGVSVQTIRSWERGASRPSDHHMLTLMRLGFHRPRATMARELGRRDRPGTLLRREPIRRTP